MAGTSVDNRVVSRSSSGREVDVCVHRKWLCLGNWQEHECSNNDGSKHNSLEQLETDAFQNGTRQVENNFDFSIVLLFGNVRFLAVLPDEVEANHTCAGLALSMAVVSSLQGASLSRITVCDAGKLRAVAVALLSQTKSVLLNRMSVLAAAEGSYSRVS